MPIMKGKRQGGYILSSRPLGYKVEHLAKAANYTVLAEDCGKVIVNSAANGTFTLPPLKDGLHFYFLNKVNENMYVTSANANAMIGFNNTGCNTAGLATSNLKTGGCFWVSCDGSNWFAVALGPHTVTMS